MKKRVAALASILAFGLVGVAVAASKPSGTMSLSDPTSLGGQKLMAGSYDLSWIGTGTDVAVTIKKDGSIVAETHAKLVEMKQPARYDAVVTVKNASGTPSLEEVRFRNRKSELVFTAS